MKTNLFNVKARKRELIGDPASSQDFFPVDELEYEFFHALHQMRPNEWSAKDSFHAYQTARRLAYLKRVFRVMIAAEKVVLNLLPVLQEDLKRLSLIVPKPTAESTFAEEMIFRINPAAQE